LKTTGKKAYIDFTFPGVGTYFKEVGDPGGTTLGLGTGSFGSERLEWALKQFDDRLAAHIRRAQNPSNAVTEVNVAAFGFSRGAALARAFMNMLLELKCERAKGSGDWRLKFGGVPVRIRFMGLFDTVASVGIPMSTNNTSVIGAATGRVSFIIKHRLTDDNYSDVTPSHLAFSADARPGADSGIGPYHGHESWGARMRISETVEEVRHFVAAHEIRNSFPLDSISVLERGKMNSPPHFYETVYPSAHSDVGGSYRPGEGGKSFYRAQKLGIIPLMHMYEHAIRKGVPLLPRTAWDRLQKTDFAIEQEVLSSYNHYMARSGGGSSLGALFNAHMALCFAWRFRSIRLKLQGDLTESKNIGQSRTVFAADNLSQKANVASLELENNDALKECSNIRIKRDSYKRRGRTDPKFAETLKEFDNEVHVAEERRARIADKFLKAKAQLDAIPNMNSFAAMVSIYDQQLLSDAREIIQCMVAGGNKRADLRPHYRRLVEAYENEFIHKKGLEDLKVIGFFDTYVHDSLAGFAKDATLPSDPRVIYVGGNAKLKSA
jgi:hypothetical protein